MPTFRSVAVHFDPLVADVNVVRSALSEAERGRLESLAPALHDEWLLRCWCAKEAAGKASGRGLLPGPGAVVIAAIDPGRELTQVDVAGHRMVVHTRRDDGLTVATTLGEEGGGAQ